MAPRLHAMLLPLLILAASVHDSFTMPVNNGVQESAEMECGPDYFALSFNTEQSFAGRLFVVGKEDNPKCRSLGDGTRAIAVLELTIDVGNECGVAIRKSNSPKGLYTSVTVRIDFNQTHPTDSDRTYELQCFYASGAVSVTNSPVSRHYNEEWDYVPPKMHGDNFVGTLVVPMPECRYRILSDDDIRGLSVPHDLDPYLVHYAYVGDRLRHLWSCNIDTVNTFCIFVHSCHVKDESGQHQMNLLDARGCALNKTILNNLKYTEDTVAEQYVKVFTYFDRPALKFECQIDVNLKVNMAQCKRPVCNGGVRGKRSTAGDGEAEDKPTMTLHVDARLDG